MRSSTSLILQCCGNPRLQKTLIILFFIISMAVSFGGLGYLIGYLAVSDPDPDKKSAAGIGSSSIGAAVGLLGALLAMFKAPARCCCGRLQCYCSLELMGDYVNDDNQNSQERATNVDDEGGIVAERELTPAKRPPATPAAALLTHHPSYTEPDEKKDGNKNSLASSAAAGNVGAVVHATKR